MPQVLGPRPKASMGAGLQHAGPVHRHYVPLIAFPWSYSLYTLHIPLKLSPPVGNFLPVVGPISFRVLTAWAPP